jgi:hypothetical protein
MTWPEGKHPANLETTETTMPHISKRLRIRVPDRLAVAAAVALTVTAAGGILGDAWFDQPVPGQRADAQRVKVGSEQVDPTSDDAGRSSGLTLRTLLFRHG